MGAASADCDEFADYDTRGLQFLRDDKVERHRNSQFEEILEWLLQLRSVTIMFRDELSAAIEQCIVNNSSSHDYWARNMLQRRAECDGEHYVYNGIKYDI
jgi:hypothetical protein